MSEVKRRDNKKEGTLKKSSDQEATALVSVAFSTHQTNVKTSPSEFVCIKPHLHPSLIVQVRGMVHQVLNGQLWPEPFQPHDEVGTRTGRQRKYKLLNLIIITHN